MTVKRKPLFRWVWRAFVQSALVPLVLVESVLIAVYLLTNGAIRDAQVEHLHETALESLDVAVQREARVIDGQLRALISHLQVYRDALGVALQDQRYQPDQLEIARHAVTPSGVFFSQRDEGRAASFYSASTPLAQQDHAKALRLAQVDPLMASIRAANPQVSAIYFNSWDSYNRILPFFMTPEQYPHDMVIPEYNFYYLADARHNPARREVWTDVYLDPAGQGWMMSAIAPVYRGDFLEGVAGLDLTVGKLLEQISRLSVPWSGYALLVSREGRILALPPAGEADFGLRELTHYSYDEAVRREQLKPEDFRLDLNPALQPLARSVVSSTSGVDEVQLGGRQQLVAWSEIEQTGWRLLMVMDEDRVFAQTNSLASRYLNLGYWLIAGLVGFYVVFFGLMWLRARRLSHFLADPISGVMAMMRQIGEGNYQPPMQHSDISELEDMAQAVVQTGAHLADSEHERWKAQQHLQVVLEGTTESIWDVDVAQQSMQISGRFIRRFGLPEGRLPLRQFNERIHPQDRERVRQLRQRLIEQGGAFDAEYRFADAQGQYAWLLSRGRVIERDERGQALRISGTHMDVSRLKAVEEELRTASAQAQAASQAKSRFLSSMSHELRTPLNAINGFAQLIELECESREGLELPRGYAREIIVASQHLTSLVDDILDLSSLEYGRQQLLVEAVSVAEMLRSCAELIQPEVQSRCMRLLLEPVAGDLYVQADSRRLRQVLLNLLSNALKYNTDGGEVRLGVELGAEFIRLWVEDQGPGLTAAQQQQLFQPFQRLGRENSNTPGTGIGLVLCRELALLMGGQVGVRSAPGQGCRFWIELPRVSAPTAVGSEDPVPPQAAARPQLLCVEDHPASLKVVQEALRGLADVRGASTLRLAREYLAQGLPALLLLDIDLPDGSGLELLDELRDRRVPVLVVSAVADERVFSEALARGAVACLVKPLDLQRLREQVRQQLL